MSDPTALTPELREHASRLTKTFVNILNSCGLSSEEVLKLTQDAADELGEGGAIQKVSSSAGEHLACTDVVFAWRHALRFLDDLGGPRRLARSGSGGSFDDLVHSAAPGHDSGAMLDYLVGLGAIRCLPDGSCELITESVLACSGTNGGKVASEVVLLHLQGFLGSVEYNLRSKIGNEAGKFERACYSRIPAELAPIFEKLVESRGQNFVDSVDEWLVRHRVEGASPSGGALVGAGAYVFVRSGDNRAPAQYSQRDSGIQCG